MQTYAYNRAYGLEVFMRTTLNIEEELIHKAEEMTGIHEKTHLVRLGLEALIARESSKRLAKLGGTERKLRMIPRRRGPGGKNGSR
jgi:Arc/MetJ family transcription regulator